jgi:hypothetical protein
MVPRKVGSSQLLSMLGVQSMELLGIAPAGIADMQGSALVAGDKGRVRRRVCQSDAICECEKWIFSPRGKCYQLQQTDERRMQTGGRSLACALTGAAANGRPAGGLRGGSE